MKKIIFWFKKWAIRFNQDYINCEGNCDECSVMKLCNEIDEMAMGGI